MEAYDFIALFEKLKEKELEQHIWELWLAMYPTMTKDTFISYEEMLNHAKQQKETINDTATHGCYVDQVFI